MMMMIDDAEPRARTAESGGAISELDGLLWAIEWSHGHVDGPFYHGEAWRLVSRAAEVGNDGTVIFATAAHKLLLSQQKKRGQNNDNDS